MKSRKILSIIIVLAMVAMMFVGCGSKETTDPAQGTPSTTPSNPSDSSTPTDAAKTDSGASDKILRYGTTGFEGKINPIMSDNVYDSYAVDLLFERLVTVDATGTHVPALASWELSDDHLTYTFTLKEGIKFSDGTPLTANDVYFTYATIAHPDYNGPRAYAVDKLVGYDEYHSGSTTDFPGIKVIDDLTIAFTFRDDQASPANIGNFTYGIMPESYYKFDNWEDFLALNEKPLGSNVMVFESFEPSQSIKLLRNDNYWDPSNNAKIGGVYILNVPEESLISAIQTNEIDIAMPTATPDNYEALSNLDNAAPQVYLANGYTFMCFNCTRPTLSDVRVRQALMYALDREKFIEAQYGKLAQVGMAPISPVSWAFPDASQLNAYKFDLEKAASLMDEAGWKLESDGYRYKDGNKFSIHWLVYTDSPWPGLLSSMAADTWKQIGVDLVIDLMDFETVSSLTMDPAPENKDFDIYTMGFSLDLDPDPSGALFDDNAYCEGGFNASGYKNPAAMELVAKGRAEFDQAKRAEIYKEWAVMMNQEIPHIIVAYRSEVWGVSNKVKGLQFDTYVDFVTSIRNITIED